MYGLYACALLSLMTPVCTLSFKVDEPANNFQTILDAMAIKYNTSYSFGIAWDDGSVAFSSGIDDIWTKRPIERTTSIPAGSVTKPWTTVAILQASQSGKLDLAAKASQYLDPVINRLNGTTFTELWGQSVADVVSVRQLMTMQSGIQDYDDEQIAAYTISHGAEDIPPNTLLAITNKTLICPPGTCKYYSSINYVLLGLILVEVHGLKSWEQFDQLSVIPEESRKDYKDTLFPKLGRCLDYPVAHQYAMSTVESDNHTKFVFFDMIDYSCLNGWTMGNIASSGHDLSVFFRDLFQGKLLWQTSIREMMDWKLLVNSWCPGCYYGAGLFIEDPFKYNVKSGPGNDTYLLGHPGADWGSLSTPLCGYNAVHGLGICLIANSEYGMNCSVSNPEINKLHTTEAACRLYSEALRLAGSKTEFSCDFGEGHSSAQFLNPRTSPLRRKMKEKDHGSSKGNKGTYECVWQFDFIE